MKLSIIIPYYKTLELTRFLLKILKPQLNEETELIIVNDGSNGYEFVNDADVFINRKTNGGCTSARNDAIKIARGDFIAFLDCDDYIESNYVETILNKINESNFDLCWISWNSLYGNAIVTSTEQPNIAPWGCIYRASLLKHNLFNEKYLVKEEPEFWERLLSNKNLKIDYISTMIYNYTIQENSLTRRYERGEIKMLREEEN